ncbi:hypothetical protein CPC735_042580 [Coccidioides posadasii C735 delta SOWgp]|uniref:Phytase-like domain-containing protein n=2 Tax=Coccidioides posadasii TaxID=199306 RepID=A0A0J6FGS6_COCPO|nr:hypothetical protein CPC735_042580 [Coccidioides posadasii C735 delta SOWgp]EER25814.1 hypothetical protein CPC735_042580 [Coccidioides posadasii C735 delta SOWgp]KMM69503.1 hypothetical protein CPAG_05818 [Coccidioides posadasii RMSCC 3488]|eukprot:XP_003067959.1 hypothetical protein CPC735_042580 [Coccidioides posadasii C735 delta SOWgp]
MAPLWNCSLSSLLWFLSLSNAVSGGRVYPPKDLPVVGETTCGGHTYQYHGLAGYGVVPSDAVDKYGDTLGGIGSAIAVEQSSWQRKRDGSYEGIAWALPDRGWNTNGTLNVQARVQKLSLKLTLAPTASAENPSKPNLQIKYLDTILLTGPDGTPTTGIDADATGFISFPGFPPLPGATINGDGFGGAGPGGRRISLDCEGLALGRDGSFWVSDEYGPYVYKFSRRGRMLQAIQPPAAYLPRRNNTLSFSAASPPIYDPDQIPVPEDPECGRNNNQGFEALTISPDGKKLFVMLQSGMNQEGGPKKRNRKQARLLEYDISGRKQRYVHEYAVTLPTYVDYTEENPEKATLVASQSEIHYLPTGDLMILARDSGFGHGQSESRSVYRRADIISKSRRTTDIKSYQYDRVNGSIASSTGVLKAGIRPVEYCPFIDYNLASELAKFGLHNGGEQDRFLLNEKWESLALVPVDRRDRRHHKKHEYFLISFSDNDYITQNGRLNFGKFKYADQSGFNLETQALVFHLSL